MPWRESKQAVSLTSDSGDELVFLELPVFDARSPAFADYLAGRLVAGPVETIVRLVAHPFRKDGVWVDPAGDRVNADCKATACGCLYRFRTADARWPFLGCGPEDVVWRKAPPDWRERHARGDWSTIDADRPEVAPWLRGEEDQAA